MNVSWGKFRGCDILKLIKDEPAYAAWYANKCMFGKHRDDYEVISEQLDCKATWINFGKYKNNKLTDVLKKDKKYVEWMRDSEWVNKHHPEIIKNINDLLAT